jgi:hypothetical protein
VEKVLALYDSDLFYVTRFMEYMNSRKVCDFRFIAFTRKESLEEYLSLHSIEILLRGEHNAEELPHQNVRYTYLLSDRPQDGAENDLHRIFKYQSANRIINEIITDYNGKECLLSMTGNSKQTKIFSIFAPIPGAEKLSFAWSISSLLSEKNNTLLVLLDPLPVPILADMDYSRQCLTEFIYYLKEGSVIEKMRSLSQQSGRLFFLSGILHGADIISLTGEDMQKWIDELRTSSDFVNVVFYLGCYTEATIELMKISDSGLVVSLDNYYETSVIREWEQQMNRSAVKDITEKIRQVKLHNQEPLDNLPLTKQEIKNSPVWTQAEQYLLSS